MLGSRLAFLHSNSLSSLGPPSHTYALSLSLSLSSLSFSSFYTFHTLHTHPTQGVLIEYDDALTHLSSVKSQLRQLLSSFLAALRDLGAPPAQVSDGSGAGPLSLFLGQAPPPP